jgi:hypothetical protein
MSANRNDKVANFTYLIVENLFFRDPARGIKDVPMTGLGSLLVF